MAHKIDFQLASSVEVEAALCRSLDAVRRSQNITQEALAESAGISRRTLTRLSTGEGGVSFDTVIRVMQALGLHSHLEALVPNPEIRPVERLATGRSIRQRARPKKRDDAPWRWGDEGDDP